MNSRQLVIVSILGCAYFVTNLIGLSPLTEIVGLLFLSYLATATTLGVVRVFKELEKGDN